MLYLLLLPGYRAPQSGQLTETKNAWSHVRSVVGYPLFQETTDLLLLPSNSSHMPIKLPLARFQQARSNLISACARCTASNVKLASHALGTDKPRARYFLTRYMRFIICHFPSRYWPSARIGGLRCTTLACSTSAKRYFSRTLKLKSRSSRYPMP